MVCQIILHYLFSDKNMTILLPSSLAGLSTTAISASFSKKSSSICLPTHIRNLPALLSSRNYRSCTSVPQEPQYPPLHGTCCRNILPVLYITSGLSQHPNPVLQLNNNCSGRLFHILPHNHRKTMLYVLCPQQTFLLECH